jgi:hypothetical protein
MIGRPPPKTLVLLALVGLGLGCSGKQPLRPYKGELPKDTEGLLRVVEDEGLEMEARVLAAIELRGRKEKGVLERLLRLLPGKEDALTLQVINTIGTLEDPKALPVLERVASERGARPGSGKFNANLDFAIKRCRERVPQGGEP